MQGRATTSFATIFPSLRKNSMRRIAPLLLGVAASSVLAADLPLNRLDDCDAISRMISLVRSTSAPSGPSCRSPSGPIERAVRDATNPAGPRICFLQELPAASMQGFRCLRYDAQGEAPLTCYRPISAADIEEYRQRYASVYAARVTSYLARAKQCPASNGDTSVAGLTLFPQVLAVAGKHEVGFISALGTTNPSDAAAVHGFATASPDVKAQGTEAFEYLTVYRAIAVPSTAGSPGELRGNWRLKIDDGNESSSQMEQAFRKAGARIQLRVFSVDIRRDINAPPYSRSGSLTERMASSLVKDLEQEGFTELDRSDIESKMGIKGGDLMSVIKEKMPFGNRSAGLTGENQSARILMKTSGSLTCVKGDRGAFGAAVMRSDGVKGVRDDYGNIGIFLFGVGACAARIDPQRRFLAELIEGSRDTILGALN